MKNKGRSAWLITWEGSESEYNGRCKIVAILPSQYVPRIFVSTMSGGGVMFFCFSNVVSKETYEKADTGRIVSVGWRERAGVFYDSNQSNHPTAEG